MPASAPLCASPPTLTKKGALHFARLRWAHVGTPARGTPCCSPPTKQPSVAQTAEWGSKSWGHGPAQVKGRTHLVFEYVERTVLEALKRHPRGLGSLPARRIAWQLVSAMQYLHSQKARRITPSAPHAGVPIRRCLSWSRHAWPRGRGAACKEAPGTDGGGCMLVQVPLLHRDIKPENMLLSEAGLLKLCDFGFARPWGGRGCGELSDYVATRWYRSPELLVGDRCYGPAVDIWAIGAPPHLTHTSVTRILHHQAAAASHACRQRRAATACLLRLVPGQCMSVAPLGSVRLLVHVRHRPCVHETCGHGRGQSAAGSPPRLPQLVHQQGGAHAAAGCMAAEMETGEPLFPGDNDVDQLWLILKCTGALTPSHTAALHSNPFFAVGGCGPRFLSTCPTERYTDLPRSAATKGAPQAHLGGAV